MNLSVLSIPVPDDLLAQAAQQAERNGISVEDWVIDAIADHARMEDSAIAFFKRRAAASGSKADLLAFLNEGPDLPPLPGDELEAA